MLHELLGNKQAVFALDIGYDSVKVLQLRKNGKFGRITGFAQVDFKEEIWQKNGFKSPDKVGQAIKDACKAAKPKEIVTKGVVSALPEGLVFSKSLQLPRMKAGQLAKTVPFEAAEFLPMPLEEMYLDWQVVNPKDKSLNLDILVFAAPKTLVDQLLETISSVGYHLTALETKPIASVRAIIDPKNTEELVVVDIGAKRSGIAIVSSNTIRLTGTAAVGVQDFITNPLEDKISQPAGSIPIKTSRSPVAPPSESIKVLVDEILNLVRYYQNRVEKGAKVKSVILTGGGANVSQIDKKLSAGLKIPVTLGDAMKKLDKKSAQIMPAPLCRQFTVAIGLALKEM